jgi:hypothetical protein
VQGNTPIPDDGAGRREVDEIRVVEEEVTHLDRAEQYLDRQARETLAIALKTQLWPAQRQLRREGLRQMLDACRLLASAQERILAAERAGQEECGRVRGAVKLDLGPESCVTPGAAILRSDPHDRTGRATVTLGREPDQIEQLDTPSSAIIRRFLDGYLGVPAVHSATWFHRLSPTTVGEAIRLLEAELATAEERAERRQTERDRLTAIEAWCQRVGANLSTMTYAQISDARRNRKMRRLERSREFPIPS